IISPYVICGTEVGLTVAHGVCLGRNRMLWMTDIRNMSWIPMGKWLGRVLCDTSTATLTISSGRARLCWKLILVLPHTHLMLTSFIAVQMVIRELVNASWVR